MILRIFIFLWLGLCIHTLIYRPLFRKNRLPVYFELFSAGREKKAEITIGPRLYRFIRFCDEHLPADAHYTIVGVREGSYAFHKTAYYLFPRLTKLSLSKAGEPPFILVYKKEGYHKVGYEVFAKLNDEEFILRRNGP